MKDDDSHLYAFKVNPYHKLVKPELDSIEEIVAQVIRVKNQRGLENDNVKEIGDCDRNSEYGYDVFREICSVDDKHRENYMD